jgi:uncharacterized Zn-finger protein
LREITIKKIIGHNRSKHEERKNICDICGLTWPTENVLKTHKKMVHSERSQTCNVCNMAFKTEAALRGHQTVHTNLDDRRIYECYYCEKKFPKLASIERHMARHMVATEAIHKCGFCEKTFRLLCDKRGHERGHKGKRKLDQSDYTTTGNCIIMKLCLTFFNFNVIL